ncbi:MAG: epoxide hydrolase family protein [Acidimicrobiales bacterium]|jgi:pimeloyl-ACP methyl ester carboxylesterase
MGDVIEPFAVRVDDAELEDLRQRLARTRFPEPVAGEGWDAGTPIGYLRELVGYWMGGYDWRREEARLNGFAQFLTTIDGQSIHFVHVRSPHDGALPLLLTHGWPGSVVEFLEVIPRLTDPPAFGGRAEDAFHVVVPSLPGHGFSEPPRTPGWDVRRIAVALVELMARLGYGRYGAQGGDWGAQVTTRIGALDPGHCAAIHLNMPVGVRPSEPGPLTDEEQSDLADMGRFTRDEAAYANEQGTKPQTVGVGLDDSPAGLLAWIVEKFRGWSDCDGDPERSFTRDQLLTNVMLYWVTRSATSSARLYWETNRSGVLTERVPFVAVPTGVARYPKEVLRWPRSWVQEQYNVTRWVTMPRGGHFAAMEQPVLFADDLCEFFRTVR